MSSLLQVFQHICHVTSFIPPVFVLFDEELKLIFPAGC